MFLRYLSPKGIQIQIFLRLRAICLRLVVLDERRGNIGARPKVPLILGRKFNIFWKPVLRPRFCEGYGGHFGCIREVATSKWDLRIPWGKVEIPLASLVGLIFGLWQRCAIPVWA